MVLVPFTRWNWGAEDKITQSKGIVFPLFHSESYYNPRSFEKMPQRTTRGTELMDKILHWAVQSQSQWRSIGTGLSPDRHRGWPPHPMQRSRSCSTIIELEEREVSWNWQHTSKTGPSRWRDVITALTTICKKIWQTEEWPTLWTQSLVNISQERQATAVPGSLNHQPHQSVKQSNAEDHTEQIEGASGEDHCWRTGRLQSRKEHHNRSST